MIGLNGHGAGGARRQPCVHCCVHGRRHVCLPEAKSPVGASRVSRDELVIAYAALTWRGQGQPTSCRRCGAEDGDGPSLLRGRRRVGPAGGRMPARQSPAGGAAGGFNAVQKLLTAAGNQVYVIECSPVYSGVTLASLNLRTASRTAGTVRSSTRNSPPTLVSDSMRWT
jgi:hypothetical protein